ncbi:MAG TPA: hypothetical protein VK616_20180, partial [Flavitalea sp.]|nr:hypothetical protein [Flavitalea sp.]
VATGYVILSKKTGVTQPKRPPIVPSEAEWVGGVDGGSWYQIIKVVSSNTFRIKIYNENSGDLEIDTAFVLNPTCSLKEIDSMTLVKSINGYDGEKILLTIPESGSNFFLNQK